MGKNNIIKKLIITVLLTQLVIITFKSEAQTPGYEGRKLLFGYSYTYSIYPSIFNIMFDFEAPKTFPHESLSLEYVLNKRLSVGLRCEYTKLPIIDNNLRFYYYQIDEYGHQWEESYECFEKGYNVDMYSLGIDFYIFKKNYIAPVGLFQRIGLMYNSYQVGNFYNEIPNFIILDKSIKGGSTTTITYTIGRRKIFFNNLSYSFGAKFGIGLNPYTIIGDFSKNKIYAGEFDVTNSYFNINRQILNSFSKSICFGIDFGIGILAPKIKHKK